MYIVLISKCVKYEAIGIGSTKKNPTCRFRLTSYRQFNYYIPGGKGGGIKSPAKNGCLLYTLASISYVQ